MLAGANIISESVQDARAEAIIKALKVLGEIAEDKTIGHDARIGATKGLAAIASDLYHTEVTSNGVDEAIKMHKHSDQHKTNFGDLDKFDEK